MGLLGLARYPDQWRLLVENPSLAPAAAVECLRYDATVPILPRRALRQTQLCGAELAPGNVVTCLIAAANRDPARFAEPDAFRLRRPNNQPLTFGAGIHYCLGAPLARLEGQIAISTLLRRLPNLRLAVAADHLEWRSGMLLRGLSRLPVAF
jgi:cytochrome P450